jgi:HPt (histidine-containing phosphotransfer) domain-containing protein
LCRTLLAVGFNAHVLAEERKKCLAAGVIEYANNSINPDERVATILCHAWSSARTPSIVPSAAVLVEATEAPEMKQLTGTGPKNLVDWPALMAQYGGREEFVARLLNMAVTGQRDVPARLRAAAERSDWDGLAFVAHSLKAIGGNLKAHDVQELAARTESAAKGRDPGATELAAELADLVDAVLAELSRRLSDTGPAMQGQS